MKAAEDSPIREPSPGLRPMRRRPDQLAALVLAIWKMRGSRMREHGDTNIIWHRMVVPHTPIRFHRSGIENQHHTAKMRTAATAREESAVPALWVLRGARTAEPCFRVFHESRTLPRLFQIKLTSEVALDWTGWAVQQMLFGGGSLGLWFTARQLQAGCFRQLMCWKH